MIENEKTSPGAGGCSRVLKEQVGHFTKELVRGSEEKGKKERWSTRKGGVLLEQGKSGGEAEAKWKILRRMESGSCMPFRTVWRLALALRKVQQEVSTRVVGISHWSSGL